MPKTRKRRRFRKTPYAYSDNHFAQLLARYYNWSTVTDKDAENSYKHKSIDTLTTASLVGDVALSDDAIAPDGNQSSTLTDVKLTITKAPDNPNDSQSSTSHHSSPVDQASSAQASLGQASSTGMIVNNNPTPSSVTTRQATGTESNYHEVSGCILMGYL